VKIVKRLISCIVVLSGVFVLAAQPQENYENVTVKGAEVSNGVIAMTAQTEKRAIRLECNVGMPNCKTLSPGTYLLLRLPKNHGTYDCDDVVVYARPAEEGQKPLGEYCLNDR